MRRATCLHGMFDGLIPDAEGKWERMARRVLEDERGNPWHVLLVGKGRLKR